jgi:pyridoxamine 5'-phosphate oxidase
MPVDPIAEFQELFAKAVAAETTDPTACALATATPDGAPSVRIVLLKDVDARGFTFFTNYASRKARELEANPRAALSFLWPRSVVQVRVEGRTSRVTDEESAAYFATRPRESQLGAWASQQSAPLASREDLLARFREAELRFAETAVPRPPHWGGYRLAPERIEFWRGREFRLHDRVLYTRVGDTWTMQGLFP